MAKLTNKYMQQYSWKNCILYTVYWGRILGGNWDKSPKSFPPYYSQSPLPMDFTPPPPLSKSDLKLVVCNVTIRKPQVWELSRLWPETSTKLYVHEFCFLYYIYTVIPLSPCIFTIRTVRSIVYESTFLSLSMSNYCLILLLRRDKLTTL